LFSVEWQVDVQCDVYERQLVGGVSVRVGVKLRGEWGVLHNREVSYNTTQLIQRCLYPQFLGTTDIASCRKCKAWGSDFTSVSPLPLCKGLIHFSGAVLQISPPIEIGS
jgi:hypothetical protein